MGDASPPSSLNKPPPSIPSQQSNLPILYYGLVVIGTAALVLVVYNFIILKWCVDRYPEEQGRRRRNQLVEVARVSGQSSQCMNQDYLCSFKYKKESIGAQDRENDLECAVCLFALEEGEELKVLPSCKHTFHAPCIDMWLYSHSDCPLCRTQVGPTSSCQHYLVVDSPSENSREGLLGLAA